MTAITRSRKKEVIEEIPLIELGLENTNKYHPYKETELKISKIFFDFYKGKDGPNESDTFEATEKYRLKRKLGFFKKVQAFFVSLPPKKIDKHKILYYMRAKVTEIDTNDEKRREEASEHYKLAHKKYLKIIYYKSENEYTFSINGIAKNLPNDRLEIVDIKGVKKTIRGRNFVPFADAATEDLVNIKRFIISRLPENTYGEDDIKMIDVKYDFDTNTEYHAFSENGQEARKFIIKKSKPKQAASVIKSIGAGIIDYKPEINGNVNPKNNNLDAIFQDQILENNQQQAIKIAYESNMKIIFYISNDNTREYLAPIKSNSHVERAHTAGKVIIQVASVVFALINLFRNSRH